MVLTHLKSQAMNDGYIALGQAYNGIVMLYVQSTLNAPLGDSHCYKVIVANQEMDPSSHEHESVVLRKF